MAQVRRHILKAQRDAVRLGSVGEVLTCFTGCRGGYGGFCGRSGSDLGRRPDGAGLSGLAVRVKAGAHVARYVCQRDGGELDLI